MLLSQGRQDEAYWLLVESIEENPAHAEAVLLMNSFPQYVRQKKRRRRTLYAAYVILVVSLILVAFGIGWNSRGNGGAVADASLQRDVKDRVAFIARALREQSFMDFDAAHAPLRSDVTRPSALKGTVFIAGHPLSGMLTVDGEPVGARDFPSACQVSSGRHLIAWMDGNGTIVWRERVNVLPFETKIISMTTRQQK
jgi:hypothetical protein